MHTAVLSSLAALGVVASAVPAANQDFPKREDFNISYTARGLRPESMVCAPSSDLCYMSMLYKPGAAQFNRKTRQITLEMSDPRFEGNLNFHASGLDLLPQSSTDLAVVFNDASAFDSAGKNVTGTNHLVRFSLKSGKPEVVATASLTDAAGQVVGCQDVAHDSCGNAFVACTFPGMILKVRPNGKDVERWYVNDYVSSPGQTDPGYTGVVVKGAMLLAADQHDNKLVKFNVKEKKGSPIVIPITGNDGNVGGQSLDGVFMPEMFDGKVILVNDNLKGVNVLYSQDGLWNEAQHRGLIESTYDAGKTNFPTGTVQIGDRVYIVHEQFTFVPNDPATPDVPLQDITGEILKRIPGKN
ncbi:TRI14-like protein [Metarhizium album ARSEF 1941]|uniref:TRI14-like protein n=1 Tax=Metarhizium album (strain ARSEF 1941) TaxID=1081103 RepID=A0A0B2WNL8_METAS|nr:TRI14-like protein [Metarhizium album ARSEF 1941]KHN95578.1 TRI14-like protein [Metarhizium album ARSEF 1941]